MTPDQKDLKAVDTETTFWHRITKVYPKRLGVMLYHNFQWKLLALFFAILLWAGLIMQDTTLTRERVFTDVPLTISGEDTLRKNGFIVVSGLEDENAIVKLKVDVPQQEYNDVTYSNYNPRVDISKITEAGEQTVSVSTTSTTTYGTVTDVSPEEITVVVDEYVTDYRIPVQVEVTGEYPDGLYATTPTPDVSTVSVSGPDSIVSQIARIVLDYDVSGLSANAGTITTAVALRYVDSNGNDLDSSLLETTSGGVILRSISVEQELYPTKSISLSQAELTTGEPAEGYEVKSVTASPGVIIAAGDEITLSTISSLFLESAVDVTDKSASFTAEIKVNEPDNIVYLSSTSVTLVIEIGAILTTKEFTDIPLSITNTAEGLSSSSETSKVSVTLTGPMLSMETLKSSNLTAYVSAEDLELGTFDLSVLLTIDHEDAESFTYSISPASIAVTISE